MNHRLKFANKTNCVSYDHLAKQPAFLASPSIITIKAHKQQCIVLLDYQYWKI